MRSDHHISREKHVRDELALQRRLGAARRAASTLMPTLRRTGVSVKPQSRPPADDRAVPRSHVDRSTQNDRVPPSRRES